MVPIRTFKESPFATIALKACESGGWFEFKGSFLSLPRAKGEHAKADEDEAAFIWLTTPTEGQTTNFALKDGQSKGHGFTDD